MYRYLSPSLATNLERLRSVSGTMPPSSSSSLRDRTSEFAAIVDRIKKQQGISLSSAGVSSTFPNAPSSSLDPYGQRNDLAASSSHQSEFSRRAADIGHGIHRTSLKLAKLAQLAKRTSMFDDPANEVEELTGMIKQDIQVGGKRMLAWRDPKIKSTWHHVLGRNALH